MKYLLYIFDLDGTIINSRNSILNAIKDTMEDFGLPTDNYEDASKYIGQTLEDVLRGVGIRDIKKGRVSYREHYYSHIDEEKPYPGMSELIKNLHNHVLLAIVTNKGTNGTKHILEQTGLLQYFDLIESVDTVNNPKPHRESYDKILDFYAVQSKHLEPTDCLMIGDSNTDMEFARNSGIDSAFVDWGFFTIDDIKSKPSYIISAPQQLIDLNEEKTFKIELNEELDLHTFKPKEIKSLVENYLNEVRPKFKVVRIIHGKGKGVQRNIVRKILKKNDSVDKFYDAPAMTGSWGATIVEFKE